MLSAVSVLSVVCGVCVVCCLWCLEERAREAVGATNQVNYLPTEGGAEGNLSPLLQYWLYIVVSTAETSQHRTEGESELSAQLCNKTS